jgi:hypothetical protein
MDFGASEIQVSCAFDETIFIYLQVHAGLFVSVEVSEPPVFVLKMHIFGEPIRCPLGA